MITHKPNKNRLSDQQKAAMRERVRLAMVRKPKDKTKSMTKSMTKGRPQSRRYLRERARLAMETNPAGPVKESPNVQTLDGESRKCQCFVLHCLVLVAAITGFLFYPLQKDIVGYHDIEVVGKPFVTCLDEIVVAKESFEDRLITGWSNGKLVYNGVINRRLLMIGSAAPAVMKAFTIPKGTTEIVVHYTVIEAGDWDPENILYFYIQGDKHPMPLKPFPMPTLRQSSNLITMDTFTVYLPILLPGGELRIGFEMQWTQASKIVNSLGIDNIEITAWASTITNQGSSCGRSQQRI